MSFQSKVDEVQRNISTMKKQLRTREDQARKGQPTFLTDSNIKGGFSELNYCLDELQTILSNSTANPREQEKQKKTYNDLVKARDHLQSTYDGFFQQKAQTIGQYRNDQGDNQTNFQKKYDTEGLNAKQLNQLRTHQHHQQDQLLDGLINTVQGMKAVGDQTSSEFDRQKVMLNKLEQKVDDNTHRITTTRGKMLRLLQQSSNKLLFLIIFLEIAAIILIWTLWH